MPSPRHDAAARRARMATFEQINTAVFAGCETTTKRAARRASLRESAFGPPDTRKRSPTSAVRWAFLRYHAHSLYALLRGFRTNGIRCRGGIGSVARRASGEHLMGGPGCNRVNIRANREKVTIQDVVVYMRSLLNMAKCYCGLSSDVLVMLLYLGCSLHFLSAGTRSCIRSCGWWTPVPV